MQKAKAQGKKPPKQKPYVPLLEVFYKQEGGATVLGKGCDIVTGETCVPASLTTSLGDAAVLLFSVLWPGLCLCQPTGKSNEAASGLAYVQFS
jgi:hypothetical protein